MSRECVRQAIAALARPEPICVAHRGASGHRLENSLEAFALAAHLNADMWEIDVQLTADGICVVSHDANLLRHTGVDVDIAQLTFDELRRHTLHNGEPVPSVREVIGLAQRTGCGLYVELKAKGSGPRVAALLEAMRFDRAVLGSFDIAQVGAIEQLHLKGIEHRRLGSAALGLAYVAAGRFDGYIEAHINAWDVMAGVTIVREAGLWVDLKPVNDGYAIRAGAPELAELLL